MSQTNSQRGNLLVIIIVVLSVAVVGVLGFILWQKFFPSKTMQTSSETVSKDNSADQEVPQDKVFISDKYGVSFTYPSDWNVKQITADNQYNYVRSYSVQKTDDDSLTLDIGVQGLGGTCDYSEVRNNTILEAEPVTIKSQKPATLSYIVYEEAGSYVGAFGLTDYHTKVGDSPTCPNVFYLFIPAANPNLYLIGFGGSKKFSSFEEAKQFKDSDTYKKYKKIISSLTYEN